MMCVFQEPKDQNEDFERKEQADVKLRRGAGTPSGAAQRRMESRNGSGPTSDAPQPSESESDAR